MTPVESRNSDPVNRVRCFDRAALIKEVAESNCKWDLVKIICKQPFNKQVQYGLSFIKLHSSDAVNKVPTSIPQNMLGKFQIREESPDSDSESPNSLFSRWKLEHNSGDKKEQSSAMKPLSGTFNRFFVLTIRVHLLCFNSCCGYPKSIKYGLT